MLARRNIEAVLYTLNALYFPAKTIGTSMKNARNFLVLATVTLMGLAPQLRAMETRGQKRKAIAAAQELEANLTLLEMDRLA